MRFRRDPLANPEQLISMVHRYVSYRVGDGAEADDITSDVFERAIRYRDSYDPSRGEPRFLLLLGLLDGSNEAPPRRRARHGGLCPCDTAAVAVAGDVSNCGGYEGTP